MKTLSKAGLLVAVALLATAAAATSAQAATFNPDNTWVHFLSTNSSFTYGVAFITCDTATMDGNTGLDSDRISDVALTFTDNCVVAGVGPADVECVGHATLIADPDADGTGTVELNEDFRCDFSASGCTVTVEGPQTTQPKNWWLHDGILSMNVDVEASSIGAVCGSDQDTMNITADFAMSPDTLTIDP
jgi:hypothetical protein